MGLSGRPGARATRWAAVGIGVIARPDLWRVAVGQTVRLARPGWWRRPPFLPLPDRAYLRFRMLTVEGGSGEGVPSAADVVAYLEWCRAYPPVGGR